MRRHLVANPRWSPGVGLPWPDSFRELLWVYKFNFKYLAEVSSVGEDSLRDWAKGAKPSYPRVRQKLKDFCQWTEDELPLVELG